MKLYNTLTRSIETIKPLDGKTYGIYSCGPTVYDHAHIGNLSAYIFADTLRRTLDIIGEDENITTKHVMNYTDVDDKTIRRSQEVYPNDNPSVALRKLTDKYIEYFLEDMETIGNDTKPITFVRATETIGAMQTLIKKLYSQGFAYIADDGIYFSISAYQKSGKKYGQLLELSAENTSESRIQNDEYDKESAHDFALWKIKNENEPSWDFEIDGHAMHGRPGWHIECSAMSENALGLPFDIHTGGVDLIFPHHENEIAQSTAPQENPVMAQFFTHNEHILVDGKKMSKSANNFFTLKDIVERGYDPLAFRLLVLQSHYRNSTNLTWDSLEAAQNRLSHYREMADHVWQPSSENASNRNRYAHKVTILEEMQNDLSTPTALALLSEVASDINTNGIHIDEVEHLKEFLGFIETLFGIKLSGNDITDEQKTAIKQRDEARAAGNWGISDTIRDTLHKQGIGVRDTDRGAIWYRL